MTPFRVHNLDTAPEASRPHLEKAKGAFGTIPNLFGVFAESPALLEGYLQLAEILERSSDFDATEKQIVLLTTSFENGCDYCMAAHSTISKAQGVDDQVVSALRSGSELADPRHEALRSFTRTVVRERGWVPPAAVEAFLAAGYGQRHMLEVVLGVGMKTLSNFTNHLAQTPLDAAFSSQAWKKPEPAGV